MEDLLLPPRQAGHPPMSHLSGYFPFSLFSWIRRSPFLQSEPALQIIAQQEQGLKKAIIKGKAAAQHLYVTCL